jgi:hypothetical protein
LKPKQPNPKRSLKNPPNPLPNLLRKSSLKNSRYNNPQNSP